jgi:uncharacterized protein YggE
MMKKRLAALAVLLLLPPPMSAGAQPGPFQSMPIAAPVRRADSGTAAGITVSGFGRATVPVTTVRFVAFVRGNADEAGAIAAMRAAGIDEPAVGSPGNQLFFGSNDNGRSMLRGTVRNVTQAKLIAIGRAAESYVRAHPGSAVENVQFFGRLDDCPAAEQNARTMAIADARRRAGAIASALAVAVGSPVDVTENGGCNNTGDGGEVPIDVSTLTSTLSLNVRITYGIAPPADGARRRTL